MADRSTDIVGGIIICGGMGCMIGCIGVLVVSIVAALADASACSGCARTFACCRGAKALRLYKCASAIAAELSARLFDCAESIFARISAERKVFRRRISSSIG